jgi:hypothetical protein
MTLKLLDILRKGLKSLQNEVKAKRDHLLARLADQKFINLSEEHWLDDDANFVNEEQIPEALEKASEYEMGCCKAGRQGEGHHDEAEEVCRGLQVVTGDEQKTPAPPQDFFIA